MQRRDFVKTAIAGCAGIAALGVARAAQVGLLDGPLDQSWSALSKERGLRALVAAGVRAANPHDSQPWSFRVGEQQVDVHLDPRRALGIVDPFLRQMHLGIGCAVENVVIAATMQGLSATTALFTDPGDPTLAARVVLSQRDVASSPHAAAIERRHTNRGPYRAERPLDPLVLRAFEEQVRDRSTSLTLFEASSARGRVFSDAVMGATRALIEDDAFMQATDAWFRWTRREARDHRDGPSLDSAGLVSAKLVAAQLAPRPSSASYHRSWLAATRDIHLATAPAYGLIAVRDPARPEQLLEAGRLWQRLHLEATLHEVAMQPLDQWLELVDRARQRGSTPPAPSGEGLVTAGFVPVMMFRAGTAVRAASASARRRLDDVLLPSAAAALPR